MNHNRATDTDARPVETDAALLHRLGWKNIISKFWRDPLKGHTRDERSAAKIARSRENEQLRSEGE